LIPPVCWGCRQWLTKKNLYQPTYPFLCDPCFFNLPWSDTEYSCAHCGYPTADPYRLYCANCLENRFAFDQLWSGFEYEGIIQKWVIQFKFGKKVNMALMLGKLLSLSLKNYTKQPEFDVIIPIPLHSSRLVQRGFNQSYQLAYYTFSQNHPLLQHWLQRVRATKPQTELLASQRKENVRDAFKANPKVEGKKILLIDDVMTTGATLNSAAQSLKNGGAISVNAVVLARRIYE